MVLGFKAVIAWKRYKRGPVFSLKKTGFCGDKSGDVMVDLYGDGQR